MQYVYDLFNAVALRALAWGLLLSSPLTVSAATAEFQLPTDARPIKSIPVRQELQSLVDEISLRLPTVGKLLQDTIGKFEAGTYQLFETDPLYNNDDTNPNTWAWTSAIQRDKTTRIPSRATTLFWHGFFMFPVFDDKPPNSTHEHHSQTEVLLHEMAHILFADQDCALADRIARKLYRLGRGNRLEGFPVSLPELKIASQEMAGLKAFDTEAFFENLLPTYLKSKTLKSACEDFAPTSVTLADITIQVPALPAGHREAMGVDPFFARYREKCLTQLPRGYLLKPEAGIFREPFFLGHLLEYVTRQTVRVVVSEKGIGIADPTAFQNALYRNSSFFEPEQHLFELAELERALPGFSVLRNLFLDTNPDLTRSQRSIRIDAHQIMMLPLRALNSLSSFSAGTLIQYSKTEPQAGLGMILETPSPATSCQILSKASADHVQDLDAPVSISCTSGSGDRQAVKSYSISAEWLLRYWAVNPHHNPMGLNGKSTMLQDSFVLQTELL